MTRLARGARMRSMDRDRPRAQNFDEPDERRQLPGIELDFVRVGDLFASRSTTQPGWRWSTHIGPIAGTGSCQVAHRGIVLSGHMRIEMDDRRGIDLVPGLVHIVPAGHDALVIGDEPVVMIDISTTSVEFGRPTVGRAGPRDASVHRHRRIHSDSPNAWATSAGSGSWPTMTASRRRLDRYRGRSSRPPATGVRPLRWRGPGAACGTYDRTALTTSNSPSGRRPYRRDRGRRR